ncbi:lysophospholipid acyltransferase family protein [Kangiella sediminilitoris]|uniref:Lipid A biosynthesis acyltransferase n=1 Tax=Kangiella sediminilitoris TaxID=1144748 RepID=A0A1B3BE55_9GAMM|nr:lysophospholipid acyltransferase family protein [Kangiella sediminilitoris]AOE51015.1 Lipid A biosynthesis acyltransferase [Kangiella sediminilitoris]
MTNQETKPVSKGKEVRSNPRKVKLIRTLIGLFAFLPGVAGRAFARLFALLSKLFKTRSYTTSLTNLTICYPDYSDKKRQQLAKKSLQHTGRLFFEVAKIWRSCQGEKFLGAVEGEKRMQRSLAEGKGVLFTGAHIGNWEVALYYLGKNFPFYCMYRPPRQLEMDEVITKGRCQNQTAMVRGDSRGVMELIKALKEGKVAAVLSDQEPGRGAGVFVPFCGKEALTMTLVQKIHLKSHADLYQIAAIRNDQGQYDIKIEAIDLDPEIGECEYAKQVNAKLEDMIRRYPEQYQWSYKRFKTTECGGANPYRR